MIELIPINTDNRQLITEFIKNAGDSLVNFRYFDSRPLSILDNHLVTFILKVNDRAIGYGHLDQEGGDTWLGIAIASSHKGLGLGKLVMQALVSAAKVAKLKEVRLSVDKDNKRAIELYQKNHFKITKEGATNLFLKWTLVSSSKNQQYQLLKASKK